MAENVLLVLNDQAGSFDAEFADVCAKNHPHATVGTTKDIPTQIWDTIVACGGDGTVRVVVNAMVAANSGARLGIVPLGTANIIARAMGLPQDPAEALNTAMTGEERQIDVGLCQGEAFLLGCGLGLAA
ncbi:diacylglycerol kinase, partial [bacterium]